MLKIKLRYFFRDSISEQLLLSVNRFFAQQNHFMVHEVAVATGLSKTGATNLLLYIYHRGGMTCKLYCYHLLHPEVPIVESDLLEGLPGLPIECHDCGETIDSYDSLTFEFFFERTDEVLLEP